MRRVLLAAGLLVALAIPLRANVCVATGSFNSGASSNASLAISLTPSCSDGANSFTPIAVMLWTSASPDGATPTSGSSFALGFAASDGTQATNANGCTGGQSNTCRSIYQSADALDDYTWTFNNATSPAPSLQLDLVSFGGNQMTFNSKVNPPYSMAIAYWAIGGSDITNATVQNWYPPTTQGPYDVTSPGFKPDFMIGEMTHQLNGSVVDGEGAGPIKANFAFSDGLSAAGLTYWADSSGTTCASNNVASTYTRGGQQQPEALFSQVGNTCGTPTISQEDTVTQWLANGVRLTRIAVNGGNQPKTFALFLKGGSWYVNSYTSPNATGNFNLPTIPFTPVSIVLEHGGGTAQSSPGYGSAPSRANGFSLGAAISATSRVAHGMGVTDAATLQTDCTNIQSTGKIWDVPSSTGSVLTDADVSSFGATTQINVTTSDPSTRQGNFFAVGPNPARGPLAGGASLTAGSSL